jgi:tripartite-type tricarboxylate transporter receptor subunit TctC
MRTLLALLLSALSGSAAFAQSAADYPNRQVRIIVPFASGGQTDVLARLTAAFMEKASSSPS